MRKRIYEMVHIYEGSFLSIAYKYFMIAVISVNLIPLMLKESGDTFKIIDYACLFIYIVDYLLRWVSVDYKFNNHHWKSFIKYPFRLISIIDLMSVFALLCPLFGWFKYSSITKVLKVFRIVRILRYSKSIRTIIDILKSSKKALVAVGSLAVGYILISALVVFNVEPDTFNSFFDAVYWSTVSLTTVGYGDIYPVTPIGRIITMISSFFGIAIVALPAGIITAEYMKSFNEKDNEE